MKRNNTWRNRARFFAEIEREIALRHARLDVLTARLKARERFRTRRSICPICGREYRPKRTDQIYCRGACRQRAYRRRHGLITYPRTGERRPHRRE